MTLLLKLTQAKRSYLLLPDWRSSFLQALPLRRKKASILWKAICVFLPLMARH